MFYLIILVTVALSTVEDIPRTLSRQNIHILLARHPQFALSAALPGTPGPALRSAIDSDEYSRRAKIKRDGDLYLVEIDGKPLCKRGHAVRSCNKGDRFKLEYSKYGWQFKLKGLCLTGNSSITLKKCSAARGDQEYILVDQSLRYCYEDVKTSVPTTMLEKVRQDAIQRQIANYPSLKRKVMKQRTFDDEIKRLKPPPKMKKVLSKMWSKGWSLGSLPSYSFC